LPNSVRFNDRSSVFFYRMSSFPVRAVTVHQDELGQS
jgi:hypothetical protein